MKQWKIGRVFCVLLFTFYIEISITSSQSRSSVNNENWTIQNSSNLDMSWRIAFYFNVRDKKHGSPYSFGRKSVSRRLFYTLSLGRLVPGCPSSPKMSTSSSGSSLVTALSACEKSSVKMYLLTNPIKMTKRHKNCTFCSSGRHMSLIFAFLWCLNHWRCISLWCPSSSIITWQCTGSKPMLAWLSSNRWVQEVILKWLRRIVFLLHYKIQVIWNKLRAWISCKMGCSVCVIIASVLQSAQVQVDVHVQMKSAIWQGK